MPSIGPVAPGSAAEVNSGFGTIAWNLESNALAQDDSGAATNVMAMGEISELLRLTSYDFSALPDDATIVGLKVTARMRAQSGGAIDYSSFLYVWDGTAYAAVTSGYDNLTNGAFANFDAGAEDSIFAELTGGLTPAIVKNSSFGIDLQLANGAAVSMQGVVDVGLLTVYYEEAPATGVTAGKRARMLYPPRY